MLRLGRPVLRELLAPRDPQGRPAVMDNLESQGLPARLETEERRAPMDYRAHMDRQGREDRRDNPALATIVRLRGPGQDTIGENEEGTRRGYGKYIQ